MLKSLQITYRQVSKEQPKTPNAGSSVLEWAEAIYGINHNPWGRWVLSRPTPKQRLSLYIWEVQAILTAFKTDRYYRPYADFVSFLFGTVGLEKLLLLSVEARCG